VLKGKTSGLLEKEEEITWNAKNLGLRQNLTSHHRIRVSKPLCERNAKGAFQSLQHQHLFRKEDSGTIMMDVFAFKVPYGIIGELPCRLFMTQYMKGFLTEKNERIKKLSQPIAREGFRPKLTFVPAYTCQSTCSYLLCGLNCMEIRLWEQSLRASYKQAGWLEVGLKARV
jgi:hypothetical protein